MQASSLSAKCHIQNIHPPPIKCLMGVSKHSQTLTSARSGLAYNCSFRNLPYLTTGMLSFHFPSPETLSFLTAVLHTPLLTSENNLWVSPSRIGALLIPFVWIPELPHNRPPGESQNSPLETGNQSRPLPIQMLPWLPIIFQIKHTVPTLAGTCWQDLTQPICTLIPATLARHRGFLLFCKQATPTPALGLWHRTEI